MTDLIKLMDKAIEDILATASTSETLQDKLEAIKVVMAYADRRQKLAPAPATKEPTKYDQLRERLDQRTNGRASKRRADPAEDETGGDLDA